MGLIRLAAAGVLGYGLYAYIKSAKTEATSAGPGCPDVRDAGPENMASPPKKWSKTDEAIDESFPASDPPSTY